MAAHPLMIDGRPATDEERAARKKETHRLWYAARNADPEYRASRLLQSNAWRAANRDRVRVNETKLRRAPDSRYAQYRARNKAFINNYKTAVGCQDCGERTAVCLDLHHRDPAQKKFNIARIGVNSLEVLGRELVKCIVLCCNCHRTHHYINGGATYAK